MLLLLFALLKDNGWSLYYQSQGDWIHLKKVKISRFGLKW